jgi:hypothetical protein
MTLRFPRHHEIFVDVTEKSAVPTIWRLVPFLALLAAISQILKTWEAAYLSVFQIVSFAALPS